MQLFLQSTWYSELVIFCLLMFTYHFQPQIFCSYSMRINISAEIVKEIDDQMDTYLKLWDSLVNTIKFSFKERHPFIIIKIQRNRTIVICFIFSIQAWWIGFEGGCWCWVSLWKIYEFSGLDSSLMETRGEKKTWLSEPTPVQFVIIPFNEGLEMLWSGDDQVDFLLCCYMLYV